MVSTIAAQPIQELLAKGLVWQGQQQLEDSAQRYLSTGYPELDKTLGGGWLAGSVNELQLAQNYSGELALLLPLLREVTGTVWLNPPQEPYAPGWHHQQLDITQQYVIRTETERDALWALQQSLQAGCMPVVLAWFASLSATAVRLIQQCAQQHQVTVFVFTSEQSQTEARAYTNRLLLERSAKGFFVNVLKRRYGWPLPPFPCAVDRHLPKRRLAKATAQVVHGPW
ncbi:SOS cell division inhibitor SulA [Pseudidiomarina planktonica]|uniref:SOS cell division inhibitor SulA n=1 Tax=Pseudidiomarina planktonica TaxID=1323738 RepID=A0A1Y6E4V8_9GAMM|nr:hypothetical protein [Pseudidiomarina planktonica]RUO66479.1 SulA-like SOS-response cell division inhibitor [Pseudidiomarina planktonica]SMQ57806.1 SOS cell division inhibitor SulA [Pseudidiomarina planktonica]